MSPLNRELIHLLLGVAFEADEDLAREASSAPPAGRFAYARNENLRRGGFKARCPALGYRAICRPAREFANIGIVLDCARAEQILAAMPAWLNQTGARLPDRARTQYAFIVRSGDRGRRWSGSRAVGAWRDRLQIHGESRGFSKGKINLRRLEASQGDLIVTVM